MNELFTPAELTNLVDMLADIRAQISDLQEKEKTCKAALIAADAPAIDGTLHRATITQTTRTAVDWQGIAERFQPSRQLVAAYTTTSAPVFTVRVSARKVAR